MSLFSKGLGALAVVAGLGAFQGRSAAKARNQEARRNNELMAAKKAATMAATYEAMALNAMKATSERKNLGRQRVASRLGLLKSHSTAKTQVTNATGFRALAREAALVDASINVQYDDALRELTANLSQQQRLQLKQAKAGTVYMPQRKTNTALAATLGGIGAFLGTKEGSGRAGAALDRLLGL